MDFPDLVTTSSDSHNPQHRKIYYTTFLQSFESLKPLFFKLFSNTHACVQYMILILNCSCISSVSTAHVGRPSVGHKTLMGIWTGRRWQSDSSHIQKWHYAHVYRHTYTIYSASCTSFNSTTLALLQYYVWGSQKSLLQVKHWGKKYSLSGKTIIKFEFNVKIQGRHINTDFQCSLGHGICVRKEGRKKYVKKHTWIDKFIFYNWFQFILRYFNG